jgi:hypothetical protein
MGKRTSSSSSGSTSDPAIKKAKREQQQRGAEVLVDPEKPWYLVKIREAWEVTGPRPGAAEEVEAVQARAGQIYAEQAALYQKRSIPLLMCVLTMPLCRAGDVEE